MPIAWAELPAPVQQLVYDGLGVMGVLALNREWRACRERRVAERLPCDTHNVPSSLPGGIVLRLLPNYAIEPEVGRSALLHVLLGVANRPSLSGLHVAARQKLSGWKRGRCHLNGTRKALAATFTWGAHGTSC